MHGMPRPLSDLAPQRARHAGGLVAVGPGRVERASTPTPPPDAPAAPDPDVTLMAEQASGELDVFGFPVQLGKVQPPLLPTETLERERLLGWMAAKVHSRLVLIVADAGYGKTTLLADWSRRTRIQTLWYRLDETDRDWVVFVNHVVAAGRANDPGVAPQTLSRIRARPATSPGCSRA